MTSIIGLVNGPNLNLLGERNPSVYGGKTLPAIVSDVSQLASSKGFSIEHHQSNSEGAIVDIVQAGRTVWAGLIINPGAYTHTSVALRDALEILTIPIIEVHLSNIHAREPFRHHSYVSPIARGVLCGFGPQGYSLALEGLIAILSPSPQPKAPQQ